MDAMKPVIRDLLDVIGCLCLAAGITLAVLFLLALPAISLMNLLSSALR